MLPYVENRPLSLVRCPQGRSKFCFFQKHDTGGFPDAMASSPITEKDGSTDNYFYITDLSGLIAGTQMNVLEWHLWGARFDDIEKPRSEEHTSELQSLLRISDAVFCLKKKRKKVKSNTT